MKHERPVWLNARNDGTAASVYGRPHAVYGAEEVKHSARITEQPTGGYTAFIKQWHNVTAAIQPIAADGKTDTEQSPICANVWRTLNLYIFSAENVI